MVKQRNLSQLLRSLFPIVVFATCLRVWFTDADLLPKLEAQVPDSGLQRQELFRELQKTNKLFSELLKHLKTQPVLVRVEDTEE